MAKTKPKKPIRHIVHLVKGSYRINLPVDLVRSLGWKAKQRVLIKRVPRGIKVLDAMTKHRKR